MKLLNLAVVSLGVYARPPEKQLQHLKKASVEIFNRYFKNPIPDADNHAHANGWLANQRRRDKKADQLASRYSGINDVIDGALDAGCYPVATQRTKILRFVDDDFKKAITQVTRNYLKMVNSMDSSKLERKIDDVKNPNYDKACRRANKKMRRKTDRFFARSREHYCRMVANEEWCEKNVPYKLPEKVANKNQE